MEEDDRTAKRRFQLKGEMDKLLRAMHSINELGSFSGDALNVHGADGVNDANSNLFVESDGEMDESVF